MLKVLVISFEFELPVRQLRVELTQMFDRVGEAFEVDAQVPRRFEDEQLIRLRVELDAHADVVPLRPSELADPLGNFRITLEQKYVKSIGILDESVDRQLILMPEFDLLWRRRNMLHRALRPLQVLADLIHPPLQVLVLGLVGFVISGRGAEEKLVFRVENAQPEARLPGI